MTRPKMWLLVLCVLTGIALLITLRLNQAKSVAPESPAGVGEPATQPPETILPPPRYPLNSQNLVQTPHQRSALRRAGLDSAQQALLNWLTVKL